MKINKKLVIFCVLCLLNLISGLISFFATEKTLARNSCGCFLFCFVVTVVYGTVGLIMLD